MVTDPGFELSNMECLDWYLANSTEETDEANKPWGLLRLPVLSHRQLPVLSVHRCSTSAYQHCHYQLHVQQNEGANSHWEKIHMIKKKLTSFQQLHSSSIIFWIYASARQLPEMPSMKQSWRATLAVLTAAASSRKAVPTLPTADHDTNTAEQLRPPEVNWEWPHDKFMLSSLSSADGSASSIRSINCNISAEGTPLCFECS